MDKSFSVCGHEGTHGVTVRVASAQNPGSVLGTMEKSTNEVQNAESATFARMEGGELNLPYSVYRRFEIVCT